MSSPSAVTYRNLWMFVVPAVILLCNLGGAPLFDVDEGAFAEATREMLETGYFGSTTLNGAPRYDKPILIYWLQALSVTILGQSEFAFRLPSALAGAVWAGVLGHFVARRSTPFQGWIAVAVTATALGLMAITRSSTADALLNALLGLMLVDAWVALEAVGTPQGRAARLRVWLWMGLGILTKGPVAIVVPGAALLVYAAIQKIGRFQGPAWWTLLADVRGWVLAAVLTVPWYGYMLATQGSAFIEGFIMKHNVRRFSGALEGHSGSMFYYVAVLPLVLMPWVAMVVAPLAQIRRAFRPEGEALHRFLWGWFFFVLLFFSLSGTKLPHYILYGCSPLIVLMALAFNPAAIRKSLWFSAALSVGLMALPWVLREAAAGGAIKDRFYSGVMLAAVDVAGLKYFLVLGICALIVLVIRGRATGTPTLQLTGITIAQTLTMTLAVVPFVGELLHGPVQRAASVAKTRPETAVLWNYHTPSFSVYRSRVNPLRNPEPGELALTRFDRIPAEAQEWPVLFEERGLVLLKRPE